MITVNTYEELLRVHENKIDRESIIFSTEDVLEYDDVYKFVLYNGLGYIPKDDNRGNLVLEIIY